MFAASAPARLALLFVLFVCARRRRRGRQPAIPVLPARMGAVRQAARQLRRSRHLLTSYALLAGWPAGWPSRGPDVQRPLLFLFMPLPSCCRLLCDLLCSCIGGVRPGDHLPAYPPACLPACLPICFFLFYCVRRQTAGRTALSSLSLTLSLSPGRALVCSAPSTPAMAPAAAAALSRCERPAFRLGDAASRRHGLLFLLPAPAPPMAYRAVCAIEPAVVVAPMGRRRHRWPLFARSERAHAGGRP